MLDPRQKGGNYEKAEFPAARHQNENTTANRQQKADDDNALPAAEVAKDSSVSWCHGLTLLGIGLLRQSK
jgi:hypothetical protein